MIKRGCRAVIGTELQTGSDYTEQFHPEVKFSSITIEKTLIINIDHYLSIFTQKKPQP